MVRTTLPRNPNKKKRSSTSAAILAFALIFLATFLIACSSVGYFAYCNYSNIQYDAAEALIHENVSECIFEAGFAYDDKDMHITDALKDALPDDSHIVRLGNSVSIDNVYLMVQKSTAVTHSDTESAASVDIVIQNNSHRAITVPLEGGWCALRCDGEHLSYCWDSHNDDLNCYSQGTAGQIDPGETLHITLIFNDENGNVADAIAIAAHLSRPLEGFNRIYWLADKSTAHSPYCACEQW